MIRKLIAYVGEYKKVSILSPIYIILETFFEILIPLLMAMIIDNGIAKGNTEYIVRTGILMLVLTFLSLASGAAAAKVSSTASAGFAKNLRKGVFENIQKFSFGNIDKYSTAGLVTRLTTDITNIQNSYMMILRLSVKAPIMLIFAMAICFNINVNLSLIFVGAVIVLGTSFVIILKKVHPNFVEVFRRYDGLNSSVQENLSGIRTVKAYVREDFEINKFKAASEVVKKFFIKAERLVILNNPIMQFVMYTCIISISWLGASMIISGNMTTGQLMSLFNYSATILMSLMMLSMVFVTFVLSKASGDRIVEVLDEESTLRNPINPLYKVVDGTIEFKNVTFSYGEDSENPVLENINLKIPSGATIGILGGTGSAKTSLVQLIPRLYDVSQGSVLVGGEDVRKYDIKALRDQVAMVLQKNVLFSGTVKDNLRWGNQKATDDEIMEACRYAKADEFLEKMADGYDSLVERGGTNFSGGQRQRLCIARALIKKPKVLILDDSTSAVDTATDAQIRESFRSYIPETTKIIIAQRVSSVQDADAIIVMDDGKINGMGTHLELLKSNEIYKEVFESQVKGGVENEAV